MKLNDCIDKQFRALSSNRRDAVSNVVKYGTYSAPDWMGPLLVSTEQGKLLDDIVDDEARLFYLAFAHAHRSEHQGPATLVMLFRKRSWVSSLVIVRLKV